jgi:hypothetical protein
VRATAALAATILALASGCTEPRSESRAPGRSPSQAPSPAVCATPTDYMHIPRVGDRFSYSFFDIALLEQAGRVHSGDPSALEVIAGGIREVIARRQAAGIDPHDSRYAAAAHVTHEYNEATAQLGMTATEIWSDNRAHWLGYNLRKHMCLEKKNGEYEGTVPGDRDGDTTVYVWPIIEEASPVPPSPTPGYPLRAAPALE